MSNILTVSELTRALKDVLEAEFPFVWVRGQVGSLSRPASGHVYFTLTDGEAALSVVWFKSGQWQSRKSGEERVNPLTGEIETSDGRDLAKTLEDGQEILVAGRIGVYEPRGQYQLLAELVQEQGAGDLALAFEALRRKLEAKGYFDEGRKMALPKHPRRVAVVTSEQGAAVRDFVRIAGERGWGCEIRIYPTLVQGDAAPRRIAAALDAANEDGWADVIALIRGGGSMEDLAAFNAEAVADALYRTQIPVVCGVGHEPDVSIADYVADKRVATPSHAAQELWPSRRQLMQRVDETERALVRAYGHFIGDRAQAYESLRKGLLWLSPLRRLERLAERFETSSQRLTRAGERYLDAKAAQVERLREGLSRAHGPRRIDERAEDLARLAERMGAAAMRLLDTREGRLDLLRARLNGLDPEGPLERGYSLVRLARTGAFLRSAAEAAPGDALDIRVRDGRVAAVVAGITGVGAAADEAQTENGQGEG